MDFAFSDEQRQLRDAVGAYLRRYPGTHGRDRFDGARHYERWKSMAEDLGLGTLAIPHERNGLGGDPVNTMIVMEESAGRWSSNRSSRPLSLPGGFS